MKKPILITKLVVRKITGGEQELGKKNRSFEWEMDSKKGWDECHNWHQTCVKYRIVMNLGKNKMSRKEDYD